GRVLPARREDHRGGSSRRRLSRGCLPHGGGREGPPFGGCSPPWGPPAAPRSLLLFPPLLLFRPPLRRLCGRAPDRALDRPRRGPRRRRRRVPRRPEAGSPHGRGGRRPGQAPLRPPDPAVPPRPTASVISSGSGVATPFPSGACRRTRGRPGCSAPLPVSPHPAPLARSGTARF